jgi:hypothetical protein
VANWLRGAGSTVLEQAKGKSEDFTTKAWKEFKEGEDIVVKEKEPAKQAEAIPHFDEAIRLSQLCIDAFEERAVSMQEALMKEGTTIPTNRVAPEKKAAIHANWAVNDVGTCFFIRGRSSEYLMQLQIDRSRRDQNNIDVASEPFPIVGDEAKRLYATAQAAYTKAAAMTCARCWDPDGYFIPPAEMATDGMKRLKRKYTTQ